MIYRMIVSEDKESMNAGKTGDGTVDLPARPVVGDTVIIGGILYTVTGVTMTDGEPLMTVFGLLNV